MMIALPPTAVREHYAAATGLPAKGSRVWITGFSKPDHDEAARLLGLHGLLPTAFPNGADAVLVPERTAAVLDEAARSGRRVLVPDDLRSSAPPARRRPALERTPDSVRILDVTLPRRAVGGPLVPPADRFGHLCLDAPFLAAARTVAIAAEARMPCALEGETAVAKTTAVLWVAHLCRQEAVRLNLNGQSDTGELVGRFLPAASGPAAWRFWEGVVPDAMRQGRWVVLDELNLAEPQVLERLNPVLEQPPSLVLSEHDGTRYGTGGDVPVADGFRIFATMNPAEYAGRSVLSPAFRDRFGLWTFLEPPAQADYRALLERLVHGVHPEFTLDGVVWQAPDDEPVYPELADAAGIGDVLDAIAAFHCAVMQAAGGDGHAELGRTRRERYVFTRRTLLATMALLAQRVARGEDLDHAANRVVELTYLSRLAPGPDRQAVYSALRSVELA
ncbi:MAG: AAA family ATPase [Planctomycetia bacterium]